MDKKKREKLLRLSDGYPAVAFDVFGTLLRRDVQQPADLFRLMEAEGAAPAGFAARRMAAEQAARAKKPHGEVTLAEIYSALPEPMQPECEAELAAVTADAELLAFCRACRAAGKKLYVVSDMYLPAAQITAMLEKCGYAPFDGVFVSSEYGVQKRSGRLFYEVLRQTGLVPRELLFFGDDRRADQLGAALAGIRCVLWQPEPPAAAKYWGGAEPAVLPGACRAFIKNRAAALPHAEALGFSVIGPLLVPFAGWLHRLAKERSGRMFFLARDMYLARAVYAAHYPGEETAYLKVSRRSLCPALLAAGEQTLLLDALPRKTLTAREILDYCGLAGAELPGTADGQRFDLSARPADGTVRRLVTGLCALAAGPAGKPVREQAACTRAYLEQAGVFAQGTILVDIGSGGTTQRLLEAIGGRPLCGAYLACDGRLAEGLPPERTEVFLFDGAPAPLWYWMAQPLLEYLISEPCGPTIGYAALKNGTVRPLCGAYSEQPEVLGIQAGAKAFAAQWARALPAALELAPGEAAAPFLALARRPQRADAAMLGDFVLEDGCEYRLARPAAWPCYLRRPGRLKTDFAASCWKIAFMKRLLPLPLPYDEIYRWLKKHKA